MPTCFLRLLDINLNELRKTDLKPEESSMKRREFIKNAGVAITGATLLGSLPRLVEISSAEETAKKQALVSVAKNGTPEQLVNKALESLGGIKKFVSKQDIVVLKPNIAWDRTVEQAANTHPEVVTTLAKMCLEAGAKKVHIFDRSCNNNLRCYANSGVEAAIKELDNPDVVLSHVDDRKFKDIELKDGLALSSWKIYQPALECDVFINVPIAKHHQLTKLTLGMKNYLGIAGGVRAMLHVHINRKLCDLVKMRPSHLTIIDATRILLAHGPTGGNLDDVKKTETVIASADIVAADSVATSLFKQKWDDIGYVKLGNRHEIGIGDPKQIKTQIVDLKTS